MPIVQISRIQHRRGLKTDLPQLAAGELGWVVDEQRLYIGNGTVADGAPAVGNTEIVTAGSSSFTTALSYVYKGYLGDSTVVGTGASGDVTRTLQQRLDDYVSVKAFDAKGDNSTDDTAAIQRALDELYSDTDQDDTRAREISSSDVNFRFRAGGSSALNKEGISFSRFDAGYYGIFNDGSGTYGKLKIGYTTGTSSTTALDSTTSVITIDGTSLVTFNSGVYVENGKDLYIRGDNYNEGIHFTDGSSPHFTYSSLSNGSAVARHSSSSNGSGFMYNVPVGTGYYGFSSSSAYHMEMFAADLLRYDVSIGSFSGMKRMEELKLLEKQKKVFDLHNPYMSDANIEISEAFARIKRLERELLKEKNKNKDYQERLSRLEELILQ